MKVNGLIIVLMVKENTTIQMDVFIKDIGLMIIRMGKELKSGPMALVIQVNIEKA